MSVLLMIRCQIIYCYFLKIIYFPHRDVLNISAGFKHLLVVMMMMCLNKGQDPACVESVAEELCVQYGRHSAAGGHGLGAGGVCYGERLYAQRYR